MKKYFYTLFSSIFLFTIFFIQPIEATKIEYYGIGASVKQLDHTTFQITTEGNQANEGFGISSIDVNGKKEISFQSNFKGKGIIFVKITQKDSNGKIINEATSKPISLSASWNMKRAGTKLSPNTKEIQIMFLTEMKNSQVFYLKNIKIQTADQPTL